LQWNSVVLLGWGVGSCQEAARLGKEWGCCSMLAVLTSCCWWLCQALLEPLERNGVLVRRSTEELRQQLSNFTVIERETKVGLGGDWGGTGGEAGAGWNCFVRQMRRGLLCRQHQLQAVAE
jgi:hypothetical protein